MYHGDAVTEEATYSLVFCLPGLGNFTYGYIGRGVGFNLPTLVGGSAFAAMTGLDFSDLGINVIPEEFRGQFYVILGFKFHIYQHDRFQRHISLWRWLG